MAVEKAGVLLDCPDRRLPGANLRWAIKRDAISGATGSSSSGESRISEGIELNVEVD